LTTGSLLALANFLVEVDRVDRPSKAEQTTVPLPESGEGARAVRETADDPEQASVVTA
jgi:hypothetical protein